MSIASLLANLHFIAPGIARSGQPLAGWIWARLFADYAFKTVINLRGQNDHQKWYRDELAACAARDCRHHDLYFSSRKLPSRENLLRFLDLIESEPRPVLIKCAGGAERTGLGSALWFLSQGKDITLARGQFRLFPYLHWAKREQRWLREFFAYYEATRSSLTLRAWLSQTYSDIAFADFMTARGHRGYWREVL